MRLALRISIVATLLAGCGVGNGTALGPASPEVAANRTRPSTLSYKMLYVFEGKPDGAEPYADLINVNGTFYGTTSQGGTNDSGTVFTTTASGKERVLYSFQSQGSGDAAGPIAGLTNVKGVLYGTTLYGGGGTCYLSGDRVECGTVFAITKSGKETVLHRFGVASGDGTQPYAGLVNVNGTLVGTTSAGGGAGLGTVFAVTTSGKEAVLHSFKGARKDGANPYARLVDVDGTLYGTTLNGGAYGVGTVFSISAGGKERVLHSFGGPGDGVYPYDGLLNIKGTLYGTTSAGGADREYQFGSIFSISPSGRETVLYSFGSGGSRSGGNPVAGLINIKSTLYGTTVSGGTLGFGTIFAVTTSGLETVLYNFRGGYGSGGNVDGSSPYADLLNVDGTLYGTTFYGGRSRDARTNHRTSDSNSFCCGTIFRITR